MRGSKVSKVSRSVRKYVKKQISKESETKYFDQGMSSFGTNGTIDYNGQCFDLTWPAQNTTDITRIGDKITLRGLKLRISFEFPTGYAYVSGIIRIIIFQWHTDNILVAPIPSYILNVVGTQNSVLSPYAHDRQSLRTVLYDKTIKMTYSSDKVAVIVKKINIKWAKKTIKFVGAAVTGADHIYMLLASDTLDATTAQNVTAYGYSRLWYDDA